MIGGIGLSTRVFVWTLSGVAALTALGLVVVLSNQEMAVPAAPPLPMAMGRVEVPSSAQGFGSSSGTPHPTGSSTTTHGSTKGGSDGFGGEGEDSSSGFLSTPPRQGDGGRVPPGASRDQRDSRLGAWRDRANKKDGPGGGGGTTGSGYDGKSTQPPPLVVGAGDKPESEREANDEALRAEDELLKALGGGGGASAGGGAAGVSGGGAGGSGGGGLKKKHSSPLSQTVNREASKGFGGALGYEEGLAGRSGGGGRGGGGKHAKQAEKGRHGKAKHVTRTADREVMAQQAVLDIISSRESQGRQHTRNSQ